MIDLWQFQSPEAVTILIGLLIFIVASRVLQNLRIGKGSGVIISLIIALMSGWYIYRSEILYDSEILSVTLFFLAIAIVFVFARAIFRFIRRNY